MSELVEKLRILLRDPEKEIWEDEDLLAYLDISISFWDLHPPKTVGQKLQISHRAPVLWGAITHAVRAMQTNDIPLPPELAEKYQKLHDEAVEQFGKATEAKARTSL